IAGNHTLWGRWRMERWYGHLDRRDKEWLWCRSDVRFGVPTDEAQPAHIFPAGVPRHAILRMEVRSDCLPGVLVREVIRNRLDHDTQPQPISTGREEAVERIGFGAEALLDGL